MTPAARMYRRSSIERAIAASAAGLLAMACSSDSDSGAASPEVASPSVEGPVAGAPSLAATAFDLADFGYEQAEFFISGSARSFVDASPLRDDGKWSVGVDTREAYRTRIVVFRPIDATEFNGTVVVEWLNVSGGADAAVDWVMAHNELLRSGYAWVGVSAQKAGIDGGGFNITGVAGRDLKSVDAARYGSLVHPGDSYSYDIFSQASQAALQPGEVDPLGGLTVVRAIAAGESQSAFRLMTYVNALGPLAKWFDGYLIHSRGRGSAPLSEAPQTAVTTPQVVPVRDDLGVPTMMVQMETDVLGLDSMTSRQPDSAAFRLWEVAGAAHADVYSVQGANDRGNDPTFANIIEVTAPVPGAADCSAPINSGPQHFVVSAALAALDEWLRDDIAPASAARLEVAGDPAAFVLDAVGNVAGGVRTPFVEAPIAVLSGLGQAAGGLCSLFGTTRMLDSTTLASLYPDHASYVAAVSASTDRAVSDGFLLAPDADLIKAAALASSVSESASDLSD